MSDPRDAATRFLGILALALVLFVGSSILRVGATGNDGPSEPDPWRETCEARAALLPATIPALLVLDVSDEEGARLDPGILPPIRAALDAAIARFGLDGSVRARFADAPIPPEAHVTRFQVWLDASPPAEGMMCGDGILVRHRERADLLAWTIAHELGHYLGLPHHDRTLMNDEALRAPRYDALADCQRAILDGWRAGDPYVAHWERADAGECAMQQPRWRATLDAWRYGLTRT